MSIDSREPPTVGRDAELQQLEAALEALGAGGPACVAVEGEPGIGKTRLLRELRDRAEARGHLVLAGAAAEFERSMPFSVWSDALDAYVAAQELELRDADDLAEILPALRRPGATGSSVADERYRAHRAMRGLLDLLDLLARERPLVVVFDDIHWGEPTFLDLIEHLADWTRDAAVLVLCIARQELLEIRPGWGGGKMNATSILLEP
ncbi:MAG: ATP-binding protein, partial [Solirubrobacteraceae bacterium]